MGFFRKKRDPISEKAQALNAQIETLQAQIKKLEATYERWCSEWEAAGRARDSRAHLTEVRC